MIMIMADYWSSLEHRYCVLRSSSLVHRVLLRASRMPHRSDGILHHKSRHAFAAVAPRDFLAAWTPFRRTVLFNIHPANAHPSHIDAGRNFNWWVWWTSACSGISPSLMSSPALALNSHGAPLHLLMNSVSDFWSSEILCAPPLRLQE